MPDLKREGDSSMPSTTATPSPTTGATLEFDGKSVALPMTTGSEGEIGIDIQALRAKTGAITLDPGYGNTGSCRSAITFIDGEQGILRYRGYPIEDLSEMSNFLEVAWLLIHGELPTAQELSRFGQEITHHTLLHEDFVRFFQAFPRTRTPCPFRPPRSRRSPRSISSPRPTAASRTRWSG